MKQAHVGAPQNSTVVYVWTRRLLPAQLKRVWGWEVCLLRADLWPLCFRCRSALKQAPPLLKLTQYSNSLHVALRDADGNKGAMDATKLRQRETFWNKCCKKKKNFKESELEERNEECIKRWGNRGFQYWEKGGDLISWVGWKSKHFVEK